MSAPRRHTALVITPAYLRGRPSDSWRRALRVAPPAAPPPESCVTTGDDGCTCWSIASPLELI
jgi:hypothetical protein